MTAIQLEFTFQAPVAVAPVLPAPSLPDRQRRGALANLRGQSAEQAVTADYQHRGYAVLARRWRGIGGEIDLILLGNDGLIFVEVKAARSHDAACQRLSRRQMDRIMMSAQEFCDTQPRGSLTPMRFDLACVDQVGQVSTIENAFWDD
jgi:putative endonuclease